MPPLVRLALLAAATAACRDENRTLYIHMRKAGLSARLVRIVQALGVGVALRATVHVPPPCQCVDHGGVTCDKSWNDLIDGPEFSRRAWAESGLAPKEWPCVRLTDAAVSSRPPPVSSLTVNSVGDFKKYQQFEGNAAWHLPNHKLLQPILSVVHQNEKRAGDVFSTNDLHDGNFPIARPLRELAEASLNATFGGRSFVGAKVRRGDKLVDFENCTKPSFVAQYVTEKARGLRDVFVMSDEKGTSRWWRELGDAFEMANATLATEHTMPLIAGLPSVERYLTAMDVLRAARTIIVTQKREGSHDHLCGRYHKGLARP